MCWPKVCLQYYSDGPLSIECVKVHLRTEYNVFVTLRVWKVTFLQHFVKAGATAAAALCFQHQLLAA